MVMTKAAEILEGLKSCRIGLAASVPCVNLSALLDCIDSSEIKHIAVSREEEGVGICAGAYLGGMNAALIMQNSGLGNSINALASLDLLYHIPLLMIMSHRGVENESICAQIPMGQLTIPLLEDLGIPYLEIKEGDDGKKAVLSAWKRAESLQKPSAILVKPSYWKVPE
ncbi:sulfopyruvate decarboxylase subunit alpha [Candidatus Methanomassiliicoccus intestinalis]|jgi:sulfopyruvate decarboxylase, alpha subunit|uniref:sulfopyruvate decarboxylase n=1 Tax=Methanomassiliicoccus intestinalis (strain Issoire-Mx1) TaxID=1295009 RepID=R9T830_METII|nr:sulfopyruvate decarboxylase subunit alpha [Candidatus Methanomassiliicoccus intestinalis]AGN27087.1 sulfopyruvate decarboxylase subunit alpha [Candidatus Methanomassiliicoccus intestinalis Issoire-Mx1]